MCFHVVYWKSPTSGRHCYCSHKRRLARVRRTDDRELAGPFPVNGIGVWLLAPLSLLAFHLELGDFATQIGLELGPCPVFGIMASISSRASIFFARVFSFPEIVFQPRNTWEAAWWPARDLAPLIYSILLFIKKTLLPSHMP